MENIVLTSRTAQELATYARAQGAPPYWPWVQANRTCVRNLDADELRTALGLGASDIAELSLN